MSEISKFEIWIAMLPVFNVLNSMVYSRRLTFVICIIIKCNVDDRQFRQNQQNCPQSPRSHVGSYIMMDITKKNP